MARSNRKKIIEDNLDGYLFDPTEGVPHSVVPSPQILNPDDIEGSDSCEDIARKRMVISNKPLPPSNVPVYKVVRFRINGKCIKSMADLQRRLDKFFDPNYVPAENEHKSRETVNDLAIWLGYAGRTTLISAIKNNLDPDYTTTLQGAVDYITSQRQEYAWKAICKEKNPGRDMVEFLKLERDETKTVNDSKQNTVEININQKHELIRESVSRSLADIDFLEAEDAEVVEPKELGYDDECETVL